VVDEGLLVLAATQVAIVPVGLAVLWLASRRPRTAAVLIGVVVGAALASAWFGSNLADDNYDVGRRVYLAGIFGVIYGLPAGILFDPARRRTGDRIGPVGFRAWANGVGAYMAGWWVTAFIMSGIAVVGLAQAGSVR
jgi:hypothetical protein